MLKEKTITLKDGGYDKTFRITQMDAWTFRDFIGKALIAASECKGASFNITNALTADDESNAAKLDRITQALGAGFVSQGLAVLQGADFEKVKELADILDRQISYIQAEMLVPLTKDHIEELKTLLKLEKEALTINFTTSGSQTESRSTSHDADIIRRKTN